MLFNAGEVFKVAIQIEQNGKKFYDETQKIIENSEVKMLFAELGHQETEHKKKFENLYSGLPVESTINTVWDPDNEMDLYIKSMADNHIFTSSDNVKKQIEQIKGPADALKVAIEFEKQSVLFFLGMQEAAISQKDQELIQGLVKEEQEHLRRLTLELRKISGI